MMSGGSPLGTRINLKTMEIQDTTPTLNVAVIGDQGVGKTSFVQYFKVFLVATLPFQQQQFTENLKNEGNDGELFDAVGFITYLQSGI